MTIRTNQLARILRKTYNARNWKQSFGTATVQDIASKMARKEFM